MLKENFGKCVHKYLMQTDRPSKCPHVSFTRFFSRFSVPSACRSYYLQSGCDQGDLCMPGRSNYATLPCLPTREATCEPGTRASWNPHKRPARASGEELARREIRGWSLQEPPEPCVGDEACDGAELLCALGRRSFRALLSTHIPRNPVLKSAI